MQSLVSRTKTVDSIYESIKEGNEYGSIVSIIPKPDLDLINEIIKGLKTIENIRSRPCLAYIGNVIKNTSDSGIVTSDDLPFSEMLKQVPMNIEDIDIFIATMGGSAHQVSRFVNFLRSRFKSVDFLIPSFCMSAGTLFSLSGDHIWMTPTACLGPIDPQIPTKDGRFVPAQALLLLISQLQDQGDQALKKSGSVPWTAVRIIDSIDKKELGDAITASTYSITMAQEFLVNYKFKNWMIRETSQTPVTDSYKKERALAIARDLATHDIWKSHGHSISREILWEKIKLKIDHPSLELENAISKLWALCYWLFDKTPILKIIVSEQYRFVRHSIRKETQS